MTYDVYSDGVSYLTDVHLDDGRTVKMNFWVEPTEELVSQSVECFLQDEQNALQNAPPVE